MKITKDKKLYWEIHFSTDNPKWDGFLYMKYADFPKLLDLAARLMKDAGIDCFIGEKGEK